MPYTEKVYKVTKPKDSPTHTHVVRRLLHIHYPVTTIPDTGNKAELQIIAEISTASNI